MGNICFIVVYSSAQKGVDARAFWDEETAWKNVETDVQREMQSLAEEKYHPEMIQEVDMLKIHVLDTDIYHEWGDSKKKHQVTQIRQLLF